VTGKGILSVCRLFAFKQFACEESSIRMGCMRTKNRAKKKPSEQEIDRIVAAQADEESAWEKPVRVRRTKSASLSIPGNLAARAAFLARLHRARNVEDWLKHIIQERIELEEAAFVGIKKDLARVTD
jgi:hypothetical protein